VHGEGRQRNRGDADAWPASAIPGRAARRAARPVHRHSPAQLSVLHAPNRSAIGTLVDRASRYTILLHLLRRHTAEAVRDALIAAFSHLPPQLRRSLTWDQGKEMALHAEVTAVLSMPVYFCDKASPWQRPSNENTNGLLRQYFPKGSDLRAHSADQLAAVACELNARPRKILAWDTPAARLGL
jgi:IS30 family transposase